jgi:hypothetical protein
MPPGVGAGGGAWCGGGGGGGAIRERTIETFPQALGM